MTRIANVYYQKETADPYDIFDMEPTEFKKEDYVKVDTFEYDTKNPDDNLNAHRTFFHEDYMTDEELLTRLKALVEKGIVDHINFATGDIIDWGDEAFVWVDDFFKKISF